MIATSSHLFTISAALVVALSADLSLATTGYGTASVIANGGFDRAVLSETDSSSVVIAGLDRAANSVLTTAPVAVNEANTNNSSTSTSTSTSTTSSTVNGVPVVGTVSMTVNGVPVATQNITSGNSTSVSVSTSTRCSGSAGCTTTTTTGAPSTTVPVNQLEERPNTTGASSGKGERTITMPMPTPIASVTPEPAALLPASVRAIAP